MASLTSRFLSSRGLPVARSHTSLTSSHTVLVARASASPAAVSAVKTHSKWLVASYERVM